MAGKKIRWRDEDVISFLENYRQLECLWNTDLLEYKDAYMREEAYKKLQKKINIENLTIEDIKTKIKGIRTTYCKLLHLERAREQMPKHNLFWYGIADTFLREVTEKKRLTMTMKQLRRRGLKVVKETPVQSNKTTSSPPTATSTVINYLLTDMSNPTSGTFITNRATGNGANNIGAAAAKDDEYDHFARSIAIQLRRLPELEALDLMKEMQVMVIDKKKQLLAETRVQPQVKRKRKMSVTSEESWNSDENVDVNGIIDPFSEESLLEIKEEELL